LIKINDHVKCRNVKNQAHLKSKLLPIRGGTLEHGYQCTVLVFCSGDAPCLWRGTRRQRGQAEHTGGHGINGSIQHLGLLLAGETTHTSTGEHINA